MVRIKGGKRCGKRNNGSSSLYDVRASVKAYVKARRRASLSRSVLDAEAEKLYHCFRDYVKSRKCEQAHSFSDVLAGFYSEVLGLDDKESRRTRSSLTTRFKSMMRKYNIGDSGNQRKLDEFLGLVLAHQAKHKGNQP